MVAVELKAVKVKFIIFLFDGFSTKARFDLLCEAPWQAMKCYITVDSIVITKYKGTPMSYLKKAAAAVLLFSTFSYAADNYLSGTIVNVTTTTSGLMVMMDTGIPTNCQGTPYNWMLIKEENKTMISMALAMWASGKKTATVYTAGIAPGSYCEIIQLDPVD